MTIILTTLHDLYDHQTYSEKYALCHQIILAIPRAKRIKTHQLVMPSHEVIAGEWMKTHRILMHPHVLKKTSKSSTSDFMFLPHDYVVLKLRDVHNYGLTSLNLPPGQATI